jgi:tRNA U54 and U55 pseudouridine synthase Pus10
LKPLKQRALSLNRIIKGKRVCLINKLKIAAGTNMMELNEVQKKHKTMDDEICSICERLVESDYSSEIKTSVAESLKGLVITSPKVCEKVNELIEALNQSSEYNIDLCRKNLHWALVDYRSFYENSDNF